MEYQTTLVVTTIIVGIWIRKLGIFTMYRVYVFEFF